MLIFWDTRTIYFIYTISVHCRYSTSGQFMIYYSLFICVICVYIHTYLTSTMFFTYQSSDFLELRILLPFKRQASKWAGSMKQACTQLGTEAPIGWVIAGWLTPMAYDELMRDGRWHIGHRTRNGKLFLEIEIFSKRFKLRRQKQLVQLLVQIRTSRTKCHQVPNPFPSSAVTRDRVIGWSPWPRG